MINDQTTKIQEFVIEQNSLTNHVLWCTDRAQFISWQPVEKEDFENKILLEETILKTFQWKGYLEANEK